MVNLYSLCMKTYSAAVYKVIYMLYNIPMMQIVCVIQNEVYHES